MINLNNIGKINSLKPISKVATTTVLKLNEDFILNNLALILPAVNSKACNLDKNISVLLQNNFFIAKWLKNEPQPKNFAQNCAQTLTQLHLKLLHNTD